MDFSFFAHMERIDKNQCQKQLYEEYIELCLIAEKGGFTTIWTGEHHGMNFTIAPNPFTNLVDLSHRTKNVRLGTATIVAPFWHPIKLAGEAAMADLITQGRLQLGIARGAYSFEYERVGCGIDAYGASGALREIVPAVQGLWQGNYAHDGDKWSFPKTTSSPKPFQDNGPPIWIAARDQSSHDFALENDCNVQVTPLWLGDEEVISLIARFNQACETHSDKPRPKIMLLRHTFVGETEEEILQGAKDISRFYCYFGAWFKNERPIDQGLIEPLSEEEMAKIEMYSPENMRKNSIIGTPEEVVRRVKDCEALGYDEYSYWIDSSMSFDNKKRSLELFIEKVMPEFN
ncbi:MAG TPA: LLM class flavin-dependent oxidoreductase [Candidatus Thioglobus sp.]|jgi:alkanesulfonate monooxygenase SsuD/methylene tetrahydromethanopterin reductase-like flavin-dependent oxidoreductase (luciferase family)|nr:LLM class flavin-dependent oxidoreductase [Candidatus Thioglobus sp.]